MKINKTNTLKQNKYLAVAAAVTLTLAACGEQKNKQEAEVSTPQEIEQAKEQMLAMASMGADITVMAQASSPYKHIMIDKGIRFVGDRRAIARCFE